MRRRSWARRPRRRRRRGRSARHVVGRVLRRRGRGAPRSQQRSGRRARRPPCRTAPRRSFGTGCSGRIPPRARCRGRVPASAPCSSCTRTRPPAGGSRSTSQASPRQEPSRRRSRAWCSTASSCAESARRARRCRGRARRAECLAVSRCPATSGLADPVIAEPGAEMAALRPRLQRTRRASDAAGRSTEETPGEHSRRGEARWRTPWHCRPACRTSGLLRDARDHAHGGGQFLHLQPGRR